MTPLCLSNGEDFFEVHVQVEEDSSIQSIGDAYLVAQVRSEGFVGHNDLWVQSEVMRQFARDLLALERSLKGEARLESMSPNELSVKLRSVSTRGNVAICGSLGYEVRRENCTFWHSVSFGFEFEPSQLSQAIRLGWVRQYAG